MQAQRTTWLVFPIIFNAEGKHCLTSTLKAAGIISLVCFEALFAEESHIPCAPGAGCMPAPAEVQSRTASCWPSMVGAGTLGRLLARAAVGAGGQRAPQGWLGGISASHAAIARFAFGTDACACCANWVGGKAESAD